jgi:putative thioredoxin
MRLRSPINKHQEIYVATLGMSAADRAAVEEFKATIVEPSMTKLVIVDFWAEWCGPCKALTPVIEKVAAEYVDLGVLLVKINVDENKFIAAQFQVRSIPTVYAMFQGQPVADLTAARTEPQLRQMIDQLLAKLPVKKGADVDPAEDIEPLVAAGEELLASDGAEQAYSLFTQALGVAPEHPGALSGMIRALTTMGRTQEAQGIFDSLDDSLRADPKLDRARAMLSIVAEQRDPDEIAALRAASQAYPDDHAARFALANAVMAAGDRDSAADALLHIIAAERDWNDGAARARLLEIFGVIGLEDPWVAATRRKLSAVLFG